MHPGVEQKLLKLTNAQVCEHLHTIQSLWSGYGTIARYQLDGSSANTVVVKHIAATPSTQHPRGWNTSTSHNRKVRSYEVETYWYKHWSKQCPKTARIPEHIGTFNEGDDIYLVLEDLNHSFPLRKQEVRLSEVKTCLDWLAHFHMNFMQHKPTGLWDIGTYWHLDTRPDEFELIENKELKAKARRIDEVLNNCKFKTLVHGDAKLANFCFSTDGQHVAAVDFQYVGGGCGMKDVAYFLGSCLSSEECEVYEAELLDHYFHTLHQAYLQQDHDFEFEALTTEWRQMYTIAWTDFTRFLLGWMPTHQKLHGYSLRLMNQVLASL
ncbi:MAG: DUF1679 domain-containing protein [Bacteroidia bacterium]|nr:DUF1679 domain-containing protein [Bacteroidia bacterium]